jgi:hypothetical protein
MQLIKVTNEAGAELEVPDSRIAFVIKQPMERDYILGLNGAGMRINGAATPFDSVVAQLADSDVDFEQIPIPEGTDAYINPLTILFVTGVELDATAIMFPGGAKVIVKEGINTLRARLTGGSVIVDG